MKRISLKDWIKIYAKNIWFHRVIAPRYYAKIRPGDVVIDCGAHIGDITQSFLDRGAVVHAFEPHPEAFARLSSRFKNEAKVHCYNQAVSREVGQLKLYLTPEDDSMGSVQASSLMAEKDNISTDRYVEVEAIRLADFLAGLGHVRFLKMDIEGAEYDVLPDMIDAGAHKKIDYIVVETHERSMGLKAKHAALQAQIAQNHIANIDLNWL
jgi:FkbM family methyltransferase